MDRFHVNSSSISWRQNHDVFLNPRLSEAQRQQYVQMLEHFLTANTDLKPSFFLASSGTTQKVGQFDLKVIAKENFLKAAKSFNEFFQISSHDIWLKVLPKFHVGGLAILARNELAKGKVIEWEELSWDPQIFLQEIEHQAITRISLVPTQVYDLVQLKLKAPANLKSVFIGGAALNPELYIKARELNWPLLPSYGMTETSSMVLSAGLESLHSNLWPLFQALPGVTTELNSEGRLSIQAPGLLSHHLKWNGSSLEVIAFAQGSFYETSDYFEKTAEGYQFKARHGDLIKVSGELVNVEKLRHQWELVAHPGLKQKSFLHFQNSARKDSEIVLFAEDIGHALGPALQESVNLYNQSVLPFERIVELITINQLPRTELGKIKQELLKRRPRE